MPNPGSATARGAFCVLTEASDRFERFAFIDQSGLLLRLKSSNSQRKMDPEALSGTRPSGRGKPKFLTKFRHVLKSLRCAFRSIRIRPTSAAENSQRKIDPEARFNTRESTTTWHRLTHICEQ